MKRKLTLCCVYNDTHILLGEKKYGNLMGIWNGFGGKLEEGESVDNAAVRELQEEADIVPLEMKKRGLIFFEFEENGNPFEGKPELEVHIFAVTKFSGEPKETVEMRPRWFELKNIPFDDMWPDDQYWLPLLLAGKSFTGKFFMKDSKTITKYEIEEVDNL